MNQLLTLLTASRFSLQSYDELMKKKRAEADATIASLQQQVGALQAKCCALEAAEQQAVRTSGEVQKEQHDQDEAIKTAREELAQVSKPANKAMAPSGTSSLE